MFIHSVPSIFYAFPQFPIFLPISITLKLPGPRDKGFLLQEDFQFPLSPQNHCYI